MKKGIQGKKEDMKKGREKERINGVIVVTKHNIDTKC